MRWTLAWGCPDPFSRRLACLVSPGFTENLTVRGLGGDSHGQPSGLCFRLVLLPPGESLGLPSLPLGRESRLGGLLGMTDVTFLEGSSLPHPSPPHTRLG